MTDYVAAMNTGLRVLMAISDRVKPAPNDVKELRRLAPEFSDLRIDDLAFETILRAASRGQNSQPLEYRPAASQHGHATLSANSGEYFPSVRHLPHQVP